MIHLLQFDVRAASTYQQKIGTCCSLCSSWFLIHFWKWSVFRFSPSVLTIFGMTHITQKYLNHIRFCGFSLFFSSTSTISHKYLPNIKIFKMQDDPQLRGWCTLEDDSGDRKGFWKLLPPDVRSFEESHITPSLPEHAVYFLSGDNFDSCLVISFIQGRRNVKWARDRGSFQYLSTQRLLKI